jgi:hypothetical protein
MTNSLHWLAMDRADEPRIAAAGELIALDPGEAVVTPPARPEGAAGGKANHPAASAQERFEGSFQPLQNGFYLVEHGATAEWMAVNTADEAESNLRADAAGPSPARLRPLALLPAVTGWPLWQYLALAALLLFAAEWHLFHRRRTE